MSYQKTSRRSRNRNFEQVSRCTFSSSSYIKCPRIATLLGATTQHYSSSFTFFFFDFSPWDSADPNVVSVTWLSCLEARDLSEGRLLRSSCFFFLEGCGVSRLLCPKLCAELVPCKLPFSTVDRWVVLLQDLLWLLRLTLLKLGLSNSPGSG